MKKQNEERKAEEAERERLLEAERRRRAEEARLRALAQAAIDELSAVLIGLQADDAVIRWKSVEIHDLQATTDTMQKKLEANEFSEVQSSQTVALASVQKIIEEAGKAQLAANRRDNIANSLKAVLQQMGLVVSVPSLEIPDQLDSAALFRAVSSDNRSVGVSVPVQGDIWYSVDGFPKETVATEEEIGATCDEAEALIEKVQDQLEQAFGIQTGELKWDGKPPSRANSTKRAAPRQRSRG